MFSDERRERLLIIVSGNVPVGYRSTSVRSGGGRFHVVPSIYWNKIRQNEQPIDHFDFYFASAGAAAVNRCS